MQPAVDGVSIPPRGSADLRCGHDRLRFNSETLPGEPVQVGNGAIYPVESQRNMLGFGECGGKAIQPRLGRIRPWHLAQQQKISPPMSRIINAADKEVILPVLDLCPTKPR